MRWVASFGFARRVLTLFVVLVPVALVTSVNQAQAVTITSSQSLVEVGDIFDILVEFEAGESIGAIQMQLGGDSTKVARAGQAAGSLFTGLANGFDYALLGATPGVAGYASTVVFAADQMGPAEFLRVSFEAIAAGAAGFTFQAFATNSGSADPYFLSASTLVTVDALGSIPLPASGLLMVSAFAALAFTGTVVGHRDNWRR